MKTLYLHVGTPKTGTSAIQFFLDKNKELLAKNGVCFQQIPYKYHDAGINRNGHFLIGPVLDEVGKEIDRTDRVKECLEQVKLWFVRCDRVVLSDEGIWNAKRSSVELMKKLLTEFVRENNIQLKVIVYIRSQADFAESLWKQRIKQGSHRLEPWAVFSGRAASAMKLDYTERLGWFERWVGSDNIIVRKYDFDSFYQGMIQADFLKTLGIEMDDSFELSEEDRKKNISLDNNHTEIKRSLNEVRKEQPYMNSPESCFFQHALEQSMLAAKRDRTSVMSDEEYERFQKQFEESNRQLAEKYFGESKPLFEKRISHKEKWDSSNDRMIGDLIRTFGILCWNMKEKNDTLRQELKDVKAENRQLHRQLDKLEEDLGSVRRMLKKLHKVKTMFGKGKSEKPNRVEEE